MESPCIYIMSEKLFILNLLVICQILPGSIGKTVLELWVEYFNVMYNDELTLTLGGKVTGVTWSLRKKDLQSYTVGLCLYK